MWIGVCFLAVLAFQTVPHLFALVCGLNVHKRCERMVPCNCGIKQKDLAAALKEMNISPDKLKPKSSVSPHWDGDGEDGRGI